MSANKSQRIIISRTDAIGDVVLTLPMASMLKSLTGENTEIIFFGRSYTQPVINCCKSVDSFINYDTFIKLDSKGRAEFLKECKADAIVHVFPRKEIARSAKKAGIPLRIGTTNRIFHWTTCNKLIRLSRKNSPLHEAQLNMRLLTPFGQSGNVELEKLNSLSQLQTQHPLPAQISGLLAKDKFKLVIHPKSHASAREWKLENYTELIRLLPAEKFQFIITGGEKEAPVLNDWAALLPNYVLNFAGKVSLDELIALLNACDGIIAASTGPLHIAASLGKFALGIYPPIRPMNPSRWAPIGLHAGFLVSEKNCSDCRNAPASCHCINEITPAIVAQHIMQWLR